MEVDLYKYRNSRYLKPVFKSLSILGKELVINIVDTLSLSPVSFKN